MKKIKKVFLITVTALLLLSLLLYFALPQVFAQKIKVYKGRGNLAWSKPAFDSAKKTVIIVADNEGTELFDMMAPFYLFNATEKANVYIVAKNKVPIVVKKGFYLLPQMTFSQIDSLHIHPDVIVIPFLAVADSLHQDPVIINWIKTHHSDNVTILSVCDGAATAAATGLFDGKPITAHA